VPRPGELVQVAGPIWLLAAEGGGRFPRSHSVLVQDPEACALVDTGCGGFVARG
jgi:glyoxylase-like metal-dependent hydrolase (beta-lactamase superfamily II)